MHDTFAAAMAWRGSVAEDAAGTGRQLAQQNLLEQQQLTASDEAVVLHDISVFGSYEEYENLARLLRQAAARAPTGQAPALASSAEQNDELAQRELPLFEIARPNPNGRVSFDAAYARHAALSRDSDLAELQPPGQLRAEAAREDAKSLHLVGLAVLFVAALVFFTFAQLSAASVSRLFVVAGVAVAATATVLFAFVS